MANLDLVNLNFIFVKLLAQTDFSSGANSSQGGGEVILGAVIALVGYMLGCYCFQKIFQRLGMANAWLAWVPIASHWMVLRAGNQSGWWLIGFLIPWINLVAVIIVVIALVNILKKLGKSPWLILLFIVPLVNYWLMYHLVFS